MPKNAFMPRDDSGKANLLEHLAATLPRYASILNISDADLATLNADSAGFGYTLRRHLEARSNSHNWTARKNHVRDGGNGNIDWPAATNVSNETPPVVTPGVIPRLSTLVASIKSHKNYTEEIGQDLRLVGASHVVDVDTWKPVLKAQNKVGHPVLGWNKGDTSALEILADRNDGKGFVFFTISTEVTATDNAPLPDSASIWKYKAIYRLRDLQVGQWSDVLSIPVGG